MLGVLGVKSDGNEPKDGGAAEAACQHPRISHPACDSSNSNRDLLRLPTSERYDPARAASMAIHT